MDRQTMLTQTQESGIFFFLKINEERFSFQGKQPTIFVAKIKTFSKSQSLEKHICHCQLGNFSIDKDVSDEISDINEVFFDIV